MEKKINSSVHQNNSEILINGRWCLACSVRPPILVKDSILCYPVISIYYRYPTIIYHKYELLTICTRTSRPLGKKNFIILNPNLPLSNFLSKISSSTQIPVKFYSIHTLPGQQRDLQSLFLLSAANNISSFFADSSKYQAFSKSKIRIVSLSSQR